MQALHRKRTVNGDFGAADTVVYFSHIDNSIHESKHDIPSPQEVTLYRKLADVVHEVESTLTSETDALSLDQVTIFLHDASETVRRYMSEYGDFLWNEQNKLESQLKESYIHKHHLSQHDVDLIRKELHTLRQSVQILVNCEYVWNVAEIFWIDATDTNNAIRTTLKFLDVMDKFRAGYDDVNLLNNDSVQLGSDKYWRLLYKNAIYGKLDVVMQELNNFRADKVSAHSKKLITRLCLQCPLFKCLQDEEAATADEEDETEVLIPSKQDILAWKHEVKTVRGEITEQALEPLLRIFLGDTQTMTRYVGDNWLDWICGYLFYTTPWFDHKNALCSLLTSKTAFNRSDKGSIEWLFGCIMSKEYQSILYYVHAKFPKWFAPHLCYFLRSLERDNESVEHMEWPRHQDIRLYDGGYNAYIAQHPKMTLVEWIFEHYVEDLLFMSDDAWLWLKNYLYFFKRRGLSMISSVFENIHIKNDKMAYLMLQCCNELDLNDHVYNMICLRMAQKAYLNNMQYGRITYWCCKCRKIKEEDRLLENGGDIHNSNKLEDASKSSSDYMVYFNKYLAHLIENYLRCPAKYINTLHDVCDNADIDESDGNPDIKNCKLLLLLSKLRDMYLCRYDLQKLDIEYLQQQQAKSLMGLKQKSLQKQPKTTPYTAARGHLISALSKEKTAKNKNLKNIADSFDIASDDERKPNRNAMFQGDDQDEDEAKYPAIVGRPSFGLKPMNLQSSDTDNDDNSTVPTGPFPRSIIAPNAKKATTDFLLQHHLTTPPRPTPARNRKHSHRKSSHKRSLQKKSTRSKKKEGTLQQKLDDAAKCMKYHSMDEDDDDAFDVAEENDGLCLRDEVDASEEDEDQKMDEEEQNYMIECCDIIISYIRFLIEILSTEIYDTSHFIRILLFSLPMLSHTYSPNAVLLEQILLITHKWYDVKFTRNTKKTGIENFNEKEELKLIQEIIAHLQAKVLATTYSNKNFADIWKTQDEQGMDQDDEEQEEKVATKQRGNQRDDDDDDMEDDDVVDID